MSLITQCLDHFQSLDGDDVMILDALNIIYVWVGAGANQDEKRGALNTAKVRSSYENILSHCQDCIFQKYLEQGNLPRHKTTTIETIFQGRETPTFKKFFPSWDDELFQRVGRKQNSVKCFASRNKKDNFRMNVLLRTWENCFSTNNGKHGLLLIWQNLIFPTCRYLFVWVLLQIKLVYDCI